jgi:hypothetical protein
MNTRNLPGWENGWPVRRADNLTAICEPTVLENVGASTSHNPMGLHGLLQGQLYLLYYRYSRILNPLTQLQFQWNTKSLKYPFVLTSFLFSILCLFKGISGKLNIILDSYQWTKFFTSTKSWERARYTHMHITDTGSNEKLTLNKLRTDVTKHIREVPSSDFDRIIG